MAYQSDLMAARKKDGKPYSVSLHMNRITAIKSFFRFLFKRGGTTYLRHASQTKGAVTQEPLADFLTRAPARFLGLKVLLPDFTRWEDDGTRA